MRITKTVLFEKEVTTYKCDYCDFHTDNNRGCCGVAPIMKCDFCGNDCCRECREWYSEDDYSDYPDGIYACPDCKEKAEEAWVIALEEAKRHDDIIELTEHIFNNIEEYRE